MKKLFTGIATMIIVLLLLAFPVFAATPAASVTGPSTVRAGDTITISVKLNGTGLHAVQGNIKYSTSLLTYKSYAGALAGWNIDVSANTAGTITFFGDDDKLSAPINSSKQLFTLTFQVKSTAATGANIKINTENLAATDGDNDFTPTGSTYSVNVAAPLSANAMLSKLTVSNATISPAFSRNTVSYTASVPFAISKLSISATPEDSKAKAAISGNNLVPGGATNVTVTVTAENGARKTYTIRTTREADPDYQASGNADLAGITVDGFLLSPVFAPETTSYVIWLPAEITAVKIAGTPADKKASVEVKGGNALIEGWDNPVIITCTAENGMIKEYTIIAKRASSSSNATSSSTPSASSSAPLSSSAGSESLSKADSEPTSTDTDSTSITQVSGTPGWAVVLIAFACIGIGFFIGVFVNKRSFRY